MAARGLDALAFTYQNHIVFSPGAFDPSSGEGRHLLAHELTHVVQQGVAPNPGRVSDPAAPTAGSAAGAVQRRTIRNSYATAASETGPLWDVTLLVTGAPDSDTSDTQDFVSAAMDGVRGAVGMLGRSAGAGSRTLRVTLRYQRNREYSAVSQDAYAAARRAALGRAADAPPAPAPQSPPGGTMLSEVLVTGIACPCPANTNRPYDAETFRFVHSLEPLVTAAAASRGVAGPPVAGAIADEYDTRRSWRGLVDRVQDAVVGALPEFAISVDRFFDIHSKLLNTLENDVGPANIKVRTALELVQRGELAVPGSPITDIQVNRIVASLLTEAGTVAATSAVIARALRLFGPFLGEHGDELAQAVLVEYFKQGDSYFTRFSVARAADPDHDVCPGEGGCRFWSNYVRIVAGLTPAP